MTQRHDDAPADNTPSGDSFAALHRRAEEKAAAMDIGPTHDPGPAERLVHELRVHQIELELQNEELRRAQVELDLSHSRYLDLYDLAPVGYCTLSDTGVILEANLAAAALLGMARSVLVRQPFSRFIHPHDQHAYYLFREQIGAAGARTCELRLIHGDPPRWAHLTATAARDVEGAPVCRMILSDVSARKMAEAALRETNATLEQRVAERTALAEGRTRQLQALAVELIEAEESERRRVAALLHDDLQQVLASARLQLEAACQSGPAEPALAEVSRLLAGAIARLRNLAHELSPVVLDHSGLVPALQWLAGRMEAQFGLRVALEPGTVPSPPGDALKVFAFRAVQELLLNVVKHAGVCEARVALGASEEGLMISVSDQGRGLDPQILEATTPPAGWGLLSLSERAGHIGGRLTIDSAPGKGSRFTLRLPACPTIPGPQPFAAAGPCRPLFLAPARQGGTGAKTRVLIVDDHQVMRQGLIQLIAGQPGIEVVGEAADGHQAIALVRQRQPQVVVMDISMPQMNGIEATRRIKAEWPAVRVIGLSMHDDAQLARSMELAGAEAFVCKSGSSSDLLKAIYGPAATPA